MESKDIVVLVHGLGGSRFDVWPIARRLTKSGYRAHYWSYRSIGKRIEDHADQLGRELSIIDDRVAGSRFHLVTFSMGGIIARAMLARQSFRHLGRVVMLAPPHHGSHAARRLTPFFGWLTPSLEQLSDAPGSYVRKLPNPFPQQRVEFGIVEAGKDRVIARGAVQLEGARDYATVKGQHGILPWYPQTSRLVERFLTTGDFSLEPQEELLGSSPS